jgi:hypothetical protein
MQASREGARGSKERSPARPRAQTATPVQTKKRPPAIAGSDRARSAGAGSCPTYPKRPLGVRPFSKI